MSLKLTGVSRFDLTLLSQHLKLMPAFSDEICYIASGPKHEMLAVKQAAGTFDVQLLDKIQSAVSINETIRVFRKFVQQATATKITSGGG